MDATSASNLGRNVRAAQKAVGVTVNGLAGMSGVSWHTANRAAHLTRSRRAWEPRFSTVKKLADALQTDVGSLTTSPLTFSVSDQQPLAQASE